MTNSIANHIKAMDKIRAMTRTCAEESRFAIYTHIARNAGIADFDARKDFMTIGMKKPYIRKNTCAFDHDVCGYGDFDDASSKFYVHRDESGNPV